MAYGLATAAGLIGFTNTAAGVATAIGGLFLGVIWIGFASAAGEEIGWRGYMLTHLIDAGVPRPILVSGLVWSAWHLPIVFGGLYVEGNSLLVTTVLFVVSATAMSFVLARMRLATGSVWAAVVAHGAWNAIIQGPFASSATGEDAWLVVGEAGIITCVLLIVLAVVLSHGPWAARRVELARGPDRTRPTATDPGVVSA